jgi:Protein of unknown function (DUF1064)
MQERMSVAQYKARKSAPKYRNKRTRVDGILFDSKLEAKRYGELKALKAVGDVAWFIMQVPFRLPGGITYRADFLVVWKDFRFPRIEDCKGVMTRVSLNKIKQVQEIYGITVDIIKK